jgi:hypothetical protein
MAIEQLAKPASAWCRHCKPGDGCLIYDTRPAECRDYSCLWLMDARLDQRWKPSRSKLVLTTSPDGIEIRCDPGFPEAWRKQPYRSQIRAWAIAGETHDVTILVISGQNMILVTPDREFELGVVAADQWIVREISGDRVIGVTVVKASDLEAGPG